MWAAAIVRHQRSPPSLYTEVDVHKKDSRLGLSRLLRPTWLFVFFLRADQYDYYSYSLRSEFSVVKREMHTQKNLVQLATFKRNENVLISL